MGWATDVLSRLQFAFGPRVQAESILSLLAVSLCLLVFRFRPAWRDSTLAYFRHIATHPYLPYVIAGLFPVCLRLLAIPWRPVPEPLMHDEFNHLLVADTLLHGRLANPPHPFWRHLETVYVLQQPSYASSYPIGQGAMLALGILLTGHPWGGVLLSAALMCAAILWMLRAWLDPAWALLGALLVAVIFCVSTPFVDTYWGGPLSAAAGAMLFGALARRMPALAIAGWSIIWLIRPFEAACLAPIVGAVLLLQSRKWAGRGWAKVALCLVPVFALTVWHNYRVTGSPWLLPYQLSQQVYGVPQSMRFQTVVPRPALSLKTLEDSYDWQRGARRELDTSWPDRIADKLYRFSGFFVDYYFFIPCLLFPWVRIPHRWWIAGSCLALLLGNFFYPFFFYHYAAPLTGLVMLAALSGCVYLQRFRWGPFLVAVLLVCATFRPIRQAMQDRFQPVVTAPLAKSRHDIEQRLRAIPGRHLVFVQYAPDHNFHAEWVYNGAEIDTAKIVWARPVDPESDRAFLRYLGSDHVWRIEPDTTPPTLTAVTP
jgi:hypothetical protein